MDGHCLFLQGFVVPGYQDPKFFDFLVGKLKSCGFNLFPLNSPHGVKPGKVLTFSELFDIVEPRKFKASDEWEEQFEEQYLRNMRSVRELVKQYNGRVLFLVKKL